jgi:hypothetical protein
LKNKSYSAFLYATALFAAFSANQTFAQPAPRADKIMTLPELRACFKLKQSNDVATAVILQEQQSFKRDEDAVKAEQNAVNKGNDEIRARATMMAAERDAMATVVAELSAKAQSAKTEAEKADYEADRVKLTERNAVYEQNAERFKATQQTQRERVGALNERIAAINERGKTINDRVDPQQKQVAAWTSQCGNRRYREEDEILVKKELAAGK